MRIYETGAETIPKLLVAVIVKANVPVVVALLRKNLIFPGTKAISSITATVPAVAVVDGLS